MAQILWCISYQVSVSSYCTPSRPWKDPSPVFPLKGLFPPPYSAEGLGVPRCGRVNPFSTVTVIKGFTNKTDLTLTLHRASN